MNHFAVAGTRFGADGGRGFQHNDFVAALRQLSGQCEADNPGADNHDIDILDFLVYGFFPFEPYNGTILTSTLAFIFLSVLALIPVGLVGILPAGVGGADRQTRLRHYHALNVSRETLRA